MLSIPKACKIEKCNNTGYTYRGRKSPQLKRGMCNKHYLREYRHGNAMKPSKNDPRPATIVGDIAKIPLGINAKDGYAIVDASFSWLDKYKWQKMSIGYAHSTHFGYMHHAIIKNDDKELLIDHINRDKLDNRRNNLRLVSVKQSSYNTSPTVGSSSIYKGVWLRKKYGSWIADITVDGKKIHLGSYKTPEQAARAYDKAAREYFGEYAYLNFPD